MHTRAIQPGPKVQCDEAEIEDKYDTDGRVTRYSSSEVEYDVSCYGDVIGSLIARVGGKGFISVCFDFGLV